MKVVAAHVRIGALLLSLLGFLAVAVAPAFAHVELAGSNPAEGATLPESPPAIELTFSSGVALAGEGLVLVDATGAPQEIEIQQPAENRLVIVPASRLADGPYVVSWTVRSGDAHPRSGALGFTVAAASAPASAGSDGARTLSPAEPEAEATPDTSTAAAPVPASGESDDEQTQSTGDLDAVTTPSTAAAAAVTTATALVADAEPPPGEGVARLGRWLSLLGALAGIGIIVFAATTLVGTEREVAEATFWIRRSGIAIVLGTGIEVLGTSMMLSGSLWGSLLPSGLLSALIGPFGIAVTLRVGGGIALVRGAAVAVRPTGRRGRHAASSAAAEQPVPRQSEAALTSTRVLASHRMDLSSSAVAVGGAVAVALSYLFDGHTVTAAPALVVRLAAVTHVIGAAVWVGGVLMLARLLAWRRVRGVPLRAAELAVRFSQVAALALAAVGVAGLALTWAILDSPGELISTPWGRFLLLKLALVGVAAGLGGYNHRFVVPNLDRDDDEELNGNLLRRVVRVEGAILVGVVAVTAALVGAAS